MKNAVDTALRTTTRALAARLLLLMRAHQRKAHGRALRHPDASLQALANNVSIPHNFFKDRQFSA
eukprot:574935-Amphidinium_carterae.1